MTKPNADPSAVTMYINHRVQAVFDYRSYWSGAVTRFVLMCYAPYNVGTITTVVGSNVVVGSGTSWPVNDVVNTVLPNAIRQIGNQAVQPASMANIGPDVWLMIDAGLSTQEIVYVLSSTPQSFTAVFQYPHGAGAVCTCSSLAGWTMRLGFQIPNFLIRGIQDAQTMIIDQPFAGPVLTSISYYAVKNIYNISPNLKELMSMVDPFQGVELGINYPLSKLNAQDPQRTAYAWPILVAPHSISPAGTMLFEIWPAPTSIRSLYGEYYAAPSELRAPGDRLPPYITPSVIVAGATADALRTRIGADDQYYDPQAADAWENKYKDGLLAMTNSDNNLYNQSYTWRSGAEGYPSGASWDRSHDFDSWNANF